MKLYWPIQRVLVKGICGSKLLDEHLRGILMCIGRNITRKCKILVKIFLTPEMASVYRLEDSSTGAGTFDRVPRVLPLQRLEGT